MENEKILRGKCLYTPKGAAREYAAVGCNFYRGCPYQCRYCYNRKGITTGVMGVDHAVLMNKFTSPAYRSKKDAGLTPDVFALCCFNRELDKNLDYLRKTGIFFSFSTDPFCEDTMLLTMLATSFAIGKGVPVKILTKNAEIADGVSMIPTDVQFQEKSLLAFGFTLSGHDELEPYASSNAERIAAMRLLHSAGFKTFASIEPVVDFESSYRMIDQTVGCCDQYLIGLMSKRGKDYPPYDKRECADFIKQVTCRVLQGCGPGKSSHSAGRVYWKESVRKLMADDPLSMGYINHGLCSVGRDWSLFTQSDIEP